MKLIYINSDLEPKQLPNYIEIRENNITIFDNNNTNFGIEILVGDAQIYSVLNGNISQSNSFNNDINSAYTIYSNTSELLICFIDLNGNKINHQIYFNVFEQPSHYDDLITNQNLPDYDELKECIIFTDEFDKTNLVARMLLDANKLMRYKGNILGIKKFLNFVGFVDGSFRVNREYKTPNGTITYTPDKLTDKPTGNYSVWIDNYIVKNDKYTPKNLPNITNLINDESIDDFIDRLRKSFVIAMKYFTLSEQDISFIGFESITNSERFISVAGKMNMIIEINPQLIAKYVSINMKNHFTSELFDYVIRENIGQNNTLYKSELKYKDVINDGVVRDIFFITDEIYDDENNQLTMDFKRIFGVANHLTIQSPNTYIQVEITSKTNNFLSLISDKQFVGDSGLNLSYICTQSGEFTVKIIIWDLHNNREVYEYNYTVDNKVINARFDVFTSHELITKNKIDIDITSSSVVSRLTDNIVIDMDDVPDNLDEYYDVLNPTIRRRLTNNKSYKLPPINSNIALDNLTDLPINYIDNFLEIITFPIDITKYKEVVIRPKSIDKFLSENGAYFRLDDVFNHKDNFEYNNIFTTVLDIVDRDDMSKVTQYLFITATETGVEFILKSYDIGVLDSNNMVTSIYDMPEFRHKKLPVNYDFELFHNNENTLNYPRIFDKPIAVIESLYPKLLNINDTSNLNNTDSKSKILKYGDVIVATIDLDTIVGEINLLWKIYNSFTNELVYSTNDYSLKYRINENAIYTIELTLEIDTLVTIERYIIDAKNIVSSFKFDY